MASVERYDATYSPQIIRLLEGTATQSFDNGDLVKWEAAGRVVIGTTGAFFGIARTDATGTANTTIEVELIDPNQIYVMTASDTTAQVDVGNKFDVTFTATAHTVADSASGADGIIVSLHPEDGAKASGRYLVRFLSTVVLGNYA
jgi:hypothetical protein